MFSVPKPRRFNYRPRFYDPQKERLEEMRRRCSKDPAGASEEDVEYFERRVQELDKERRSGKLTWKDAFRKRKMPKFEYKSRFSGEGDAEGRPLPPSGHSTLGRGKPDSKEQFRESGTRIKRRFDFHKDFHRDQFRVGVVIAIVVIGGYILYRYFDSITEGLWNLFF